MNNQIPNFYNYYQNPNQNLGLNFNNFLFERIDNRLNRIERQIKILENKLNSLENEKTNFLSSTHDEDDSMYML